MQAIDCTLCPLNLHLKTCLAPSEIQANSSYDDVTLKPSSSAAARRSSIHSGEIRRSSFVEACAMQRHILTHIASDCQALTRARAPTHAARHAKPVSHQPLRRNRPLGGKNIRKFAINSVVKKQCSSYIARIAIQTNGTNAGSPSSANSRSYLTDALNSVIAQLNADGNTVANSYAYSPYGESQTIGVDGTSNSNQYTSRENDNTGLYFYRARYYDPVLKRFINEDPIRTRAGLNFYQYVEGNPLSMVDPNGLDAMIAHNGVLEYYNSKGELVGTYAYTTGLPGCKCDSTTPYKGPIPSGFYMADPSQVGAGGFFRDLLGDWGRFRVPLKPHPNTQTFGRDGFFLHGGKKPGSAGCIDVGGSDVELFKHLKNATGKVPLVVY
jgi:RHS repeat-associated protein